MTPTVSPRFSKLSAIMPSHHSLKSIPSLFPTNSRFRSLLEGTTTRPFPPFHLGILNRSGTSSTTLRHQYATFYLPSFSHNHQLLMKYGSNKGRCSGDAEFLINNKGYLRYCGLFLMGLYQATRPRPRLLLLLMCNINFTTNLHNYWVTGRCLIACAMHCIMNHEVWRRTRDLASQSLFPLSLISQSA